MKYFWSNEILKEALEGKIDGKRPGGRSIDSARHTGSTLNAQR